jgi:dipeptidyl aminopeptidase/acylaminoacyl peptidase
LLGTLVVVAAVAGYAVTRAGDPTGSSASAEGRAPTARVENATLFYRSTADATYGEVLSVAPGGSQSGATSTERRCDRIDVLPDDTMVCMKAEPAETLRTRLTVVREDGRVVDSWVVPGTPSRVRFSPDGRLVASTTFVDGHSYTQAALSTWTVVRRVGGSSVNLERYRLTLEGEPRSSEDRNYWGVTFVDDRRFYATLRTGDATWLVRGDVATGSLVTVRTDAECPSLSPDGRHLVYKKRTGDPEAPWRLAVLDLRSREERDLGETRSVDDQVEWLDDDTVLYALPRPDVVGRDDVWEVDVTPGARPQLLLRDAASPSVVPVRSGSTS